MASAEWVKVRNATGEKKWVPWIGFSGGEIEAGEVASVRADVYASMDWSHGMFPRVDATKK